MAVMAASSNTEARNKPVIAVRDLCNRFGEHVVHENLDLIRLEVPKEFAEPLV